MKTELDINTLDACSERKAGIICGRPANQSRDNHRELKYSQNRIVSPRVMCQRTANDFTAHGSAWQLAPQNTEQKISPRGGLRPLIGLSPVTALANSQHWSDTNGEERKSLLFLETEENERWPPFGGTSMGFVPNWRDTSVPSRDAWLTFKLTTVFIVETFHCCCHY